MKHIITDTIESYVYNIGETAAIFGSYERLNKNLASIVDVKNHFEIWNCPLIVREGKYTYKNGEYVRQ